MILFFLAAIECPDVFRQFQGRCYYFEKNLQKAWFDAMRDCESHNDGDLHYNLVSVHNEEENNFIKNLLMEQSWYREPNLEISDPRLPWIGLRKNRVSLWNDTDNVRWVDDSPFGYNKWAENEPRDEVSMQMVQNIFVVLYYTKAILQSDHWIYIQFN